MVNPDVVENLSDVNVSGQQTIKRKSVDDSLDDKDPPVAEEENDKKNCCCLALQILIWLGISGTLFRFESLIFFTKKYTDYDTDSYKWFDFVTFIFYFIMVIIIILYLIFERKKIKPFTTLEFIISLLAIGDGTYNLT